MPTVGVSPEHDDRVRSRPHVQSAPVAAGGLHHRPTHTVAVDLDRLAVDPEQADGVLTMDTAELEEAAPGRRPERPRRRLRSVDPAYVQRAPARRPAVSPQPSPNPIAVEVAERYAKALTLSADTPSPPAPRTPRRSRAVMRDRALDPPVRTPARRRAPNPAPDAAAPTRQRPANPSEQAPRSRVASPASTQAPRSRATAPATTPARRRATPPPAAGTSTALPTPAAPAAEPTTGRRTVTIRGRGAERDYGWTQYDSSRRPGVPAHERPGFKPDRAALWAVFLGLLLVLVAATSAHAAVLTHAVH